MDTTVKIFNQFYNLDLVVSAYEYELVYSFFIKYLSDEQTAKSFSENLFRVANITQVPVLDLLASFGNGSALEINATMSYYLNSLNNKTVLYGVSSPMIPNNVVQRNIVQ
jgi:hypothetical protein